MTESTQLYPGEHWYCIRAKPKKEKSAAANLSAMLGLEVFCPQIRFRRKTVRGAVWFQEAMFPGYFFARFDLFEMKRAVMHTPGVLNIPIFDGYCVPVPDSVIESIRAELAEDHVADAGLPLEVGEVTTVLDGPMQGMQVKVIRLLPAAERVAVLLDMLGTCVEAEFSVGSLEQRNRHPLVAEN